MPLSLLPHARPLDPPNIGLSQLMSLCANDRQDFSVWAEFLRRVTPKIKCFIRGSLRQSLGSSMTTSHNVVIPGGAQEKDLFQNTILRLVENDCAAMKRFTGDKEEEVLAYLAVITRSVVRDCLRKELAQRRPFSRSAVEFSVMTMDRPSAEGRATERPIAEKELLSREIKELSEQTLQRPARQFSIRDKMIFQLYFYDGLSAKQIAHCEGVRLSKAGVEKVLERLKECLRRAALVGVSEGIVQ
jgi:RNA polymerase sigma-70 factor (ECF subfamily)